MSDSLLSTLKPRQLEAIKHTQAPQLILADAGTGKTDEVEIIDYKAGKYEPGHVERSRQLLLYASGIEHVTR